MFLSKLVLNPMNAFARKNFAAPYEMHRTLCNMFSEERRPEILFRIEQISRKNAEMAVLMQSFAKPVIDQQENDYLLDYQIKYIDDPDLRNMIAQKGHYNFRLVANPIKKQGNKKIPLHKDKDHYDWIIRKAGQSGFEIEYVNMDHFTVNIAKRSQKEGNNSKNFRIFGVKYDGILKITNAELFAKAYFHGIGSSKSFGFGMLSLKKLA